MNLSNYLQMPPAPQSPAPAGTSSAPTVASLAGLDAAGRFKLDFARIMAQQFQQLPSVKRQDLAALRASTPSETARTGQRPTTRDERDNADSAPDNAAGNNGRSNARASQAGLASTRASLLARADAHSSQRALPNANGSRSASTDTPSRRETQTDAARDPIPRTDAEPSAERQSVRLAEAEAPPWWAGAMATAPLVARAPAPVSADATPAAPSAAALSLPDGTQLQSLNLSPEVQIVTDPSRAPTPHSLLNFAREMGLDETSLRQLVGEAHGPLTQPGSGNAGTAAGWLATQLIQQRQTAPAPGVSPVLPMQVGGAEWLQSGWLPAAPAANPGAGAMTVDVLTLSGADLPQAQITALAESFLAGDDASSSSDNPNQPHDGQPALGSSATASTGLNAASPRDAQASTAARPMAEVYQQLSDKLSTEMAARMHQQISAGEWKMKFGLRPAHLGSVEIQLEMKDGKLHADLAADNPLTRELLQNGSQRLRESLANLGIQAERVSVGHGQTLFGQGQTGSQGQGASQRGQLEDNPKLSAASASSLSEPARVAPKDPDGLLDLYA